MYAIRSYYEKAKKSKSDEFYTQLSDIESELQHYKSHFENKVVYCNCDDPQISNFFNYFVINFKELGLKRIIASCYREQVRDLFNTKENENGFFYEYLIVITSYSIHYTKLYESTPKRRTPFRWWPKPCRWPC